jgi:hypothetical protein
MPQNGVVSGALAKNQNGDSALYDRKQKTIRTFRFTNLFSISFRALTLVHRLG